MAKKLPASILDLTIEEKILQLTRYGYSPHGVAEKVIPSNCYMSEAPYVRYHVFNAEGELFAACSEEKALNHYAKQPGNRVERQKTSPYQVGLWRWNQRMVAEIYEMQKGFHRANLVHWRDAADLKAYHGIYGAIAEACGSDRWRKVEGDAIDYAPGFGGRGHEFLTQEGRVFVDIGEESGTIYMAQIALERKGAGLGTHIMDAIRDYALEKRMGICIYKITNADYWERFDWLKLTDGGDRQVSYAEIKAWAESARMIRP